MPKYRAIVSIEFGDDDLKKLQEEIGAKEPINPFDAVRFELDSFSFGTTSIEQIFRDGDMLLTRLSGGIYVEVDDHDLE